MPKGRLFLSPEKHGLFYRALAPLGGKKKKKDRPCVRLPIIGGKMLRVSKRALSATLRALAHSTKFRAMIVPDAVPPLLRRLAASDNGPQEYVVGDSLLERTFGMIPPQFVPSLGDPALSWETPQPYRLPRERETRERLPLSPPRALTSWQASVVVYCWAEGAATAAGLPPCVLYFFYRDWLMDQVKVSRIDSGLRVSATRLLAWACGGSNEELDACAARVPAQPLAEAQGQVSCDIVRAELCFEHPCLHPAQPPTSDHDGRMTCWMSTARQSVRHAILKFDRARVQPLRLWEAIREISQPGEEDEFNLVFDARAVYLYITHELWRRIILERVPLLLVSGLARLKFQECRASPIAPFLVAAYAAGTDATTTLAVRGLFALLFHKIATGEMDPHLIQVIPRILNRYPDIVSRIRAAYRDELVEGKGFHRDRPGFFAGLYSLTLSRAHRAITREGCQLLPVSFTRHKLEHNLASNSRGDTLAPLIRLSEGEIYALYDSATPDVLESFISLTGGLILPAERSIIETISPTSRRTHTSEPDGFARALYEAERLANIRIDARGETPDRPEPKIELDQREMWNRDLAPGVPAKRAFFTIVSAKTPTGPNDPLYSAHEDAEACLRIHPVTCVRILPEFEIPEELEDVAKMFIFENDMETTDLRSERLNSPQTLAMEKILDDRSGGKTKPYSEGDE